MSAGSLHATRGRTRAHQLLYRRMLSVWGDVGGLDEEFVSAFRARRGLLFHGLQQDCAM